jgi:transcriptional regulator with XRE-family HTH domain
MKGSDIVVSGESPAVARRRLRLALRREREAEGLTQGQVAEALDWSLSKVNRIESGELTVSSSDLRALLGLFGITDRVQIDRLLENAKASRRRGWWDEPKYREHLTPATMQLLQFETEATAIRSYQPTLMPGLMQTRAYAQIVLDLSLERLSEADKAVHLEVRLQRREHVLDRPDPPQYMVIFDESVLLRDFVGPRVMVEQFLEVLSLVRMSNTIMRILPLAKGAQIAVAGQFTVFDLGDEENAVSYQESAQADEISYGSEGVNLRRGFFEKMWDESLTAEASIRQLEARSAAMLSALDRGSQAANPYSRWRVL